MKTKKIERVWYSVAVLAVLAAIGVWVPMAYAKAEPVILSDQEFDAKVAALRPPELETGAWDRFQPRYQALMEEKKYEEALVNIAWYWDHVLEYLRVTYGYRPYFLVLDWKTLAEVYPPAREQMIRRRDREEATLRVGDWRTEYPWLKPEGGIRDYPPQSQKDWDDQSLARKGDRSLFRDVLQLSLALNEPEHVRDFAVLVDREHPVFFKASLEMISYELFQAEAYELLSKHIPDVYAEWGRDQEKLADMFKMRATLKAANPKYNDENHCQAAIAYARLNSAQLAKLARWQGHEEVAARIEKEMNELEPEYRKKIAEEIAKPEANGSSAPEAR